MGDRIKIKNYKKEKKREKIKDKILIYVLK